jgi:hypothetical protein
MTDGKVKNNVKKGDTGETIFSLSITSSKFYIYIEGKFTNKPMTKKVEEELTFGLDIWKLEKSTIYAVWFPTI